MVRTIGSLRLGLTVVTLLSAYGCATPNGKEAATPRIEPVYRVSSSPQAVSAIYQSGRHELGQGRYDAARGLFQQVLQMDPESVDAMNGLAVAHANLGQTDEALRWFAEAIRRSPDVGYLRANYGRLLLKSGRLDEAERELKHAQALFGAMNAQADASLRELQAALAQGGVRAASSVVAASDPGTDARRADATGSGATPAAAWSAAPVAGSTIAETPPAPASMARVAPGIFELRPHVPAPAPVAVNADRSEPPTRLVEPSAASVRGAATAAVPVQAAAQPSASSALEQSKSERLSPVRIEVSNGNGINGMARRTATLLQTRDGLRVSRVTNYASFALPQTQVQYRFGDERVAAQLASTLPAEVMLVEASNLRVGVDVRLVLGRDRAARLIADGALPSSAPALALRDPAIR